MIAQTSSADALVSPLAKHFDSIYSAARLLMENQGARSMSDLVSTHQFVTDGQHRCPRRRSSAPLPGDTQ